MLTRFYLLLVIGQPLFVVAVVVSVVVVVGGGFCRLDEDGQANR